MDRIILHSARKFFVIPLICLALLLISGCKKDSELDREKFLGTYTVTEDCLSGPFAYNMSISASSDSDDIVLITNMYDYGDVLNATINRNQLTIPSQEHDGYTYQGSGSISGNTLTVDYTISAGTAESDECTAICTRQ